MRAFIFLFVVAALASALLTPLARRLALRLGAVSNPGGRNVNERAVPRLGGIAIVAAFLLSMAGMFVSNSSVASIIRAQGLRVVGLVIGGLVMCLVGVLDDARRVRALYKLISHVAVAIVVFACGFRIDAIELPLVGPMSMGIFALPVTIFWIVGIINAVNLIDGLDGLAGGIVFFAGITNFVVAYVTGSTFVASIMAAMLGSVLGFLFFNFNPARIFMGDSGSYFLGFLLGAMSLAGSSQKASTAVSILVPIVALGVPIFDTLFTMVRRFVERRPLFSADRGHVHHRLLDMGITHRRAVLILYGVSIVLTVAAIAVSLGRSWEVGVAILAASVVIIGLVRFLGYFEYLFVMRRQRARIRNADTEALRRALPEVLHALGAAANEATILNVLEALTQTAGLNAVELVTAQTSVEILRFFRQSTATSDQVSARYPVGEEHDARTHLRFRWQSSSGDVSPQTEVLLQVVVDTAAIALARVDSAFAPHVPARLQAERSSARRLSQTARAEG